MRRALRSGGPVSQAAVEALAASYAGTAVELDALRAGRWTVEWAAGPLPWRLLPWRVAAGQDVDYVTRSVTNFADVAGGAVAVRARGELDGPVGRGATLPLALSASVSEVSVALGERASVRLPVEGDGDFDVLAASDQAGVRVFRSGAGLVVQLREEP